MTAPCYIIRNLPMNLGKAMTKSVYFCFSKKGEALAHEISERMPGKVVRVKNLHACVKSEFKPGTRLLFIGALGICVRGIAPLIHSKTSDPAVVVMDELGRFVIPVLSGHLGGANGWALELAAKTGAAPVVTTATDINQVFAVDSFARTAGLNLLHPEAIKVVSSRLLEGKQVFLLCDFKVKGPLAQGLTLWPEEEPNLAHKIQDQPTIDHKIPNQKNQDDLEESEKFAGIVISPYIKARPFQHLVQLIPPVIHVGLGARRNTSPARLEQFYCDTLKKLGIHSSAVADIASIDLKKDEKALIDLAEKERIPFKVYSKEALLPYSHLFDESDFVKRITGVGNVCETAAYVASGEGEILLSKHSRDGMTIAIAMEEYSISF